MLTTCAACRAQLQPRPQALQSRRLWELHQRSLQPQGRQQPHLVRLVMSMQMHGHQRWSCGDCICQQPDSWPHGLASSRMYSWEPMLQSHVLRYWGLVPAVAVQTASQQLFKKHLPHHCLLRLKKPELVMVLQALGVAQLQMQDWGRRLPRLLAPWRRTQPAAPCRRQSRQTLIGLSRPSMQRRWRLPH